MIQKWRKRMPLWTQTLGTEFDLEHRVNHCSSWESFSTVWSMYRNWKSKCKKDETSVDSTVTVKDLCDAEMLIFKSVQQKGVQRGYQDTTRRQRHEKWKQNRRKRRKIPDKRASKIHKLDPFTDSDGLLRVGGRIKADSIDERVKHPILLPKKGHISQTDNQALSWTYNIKDAVWQWTN